MTRCCRSPEHHRASGGRKRVQNAQLYSAARIWARQADLTLRQTSPRCGRWIAESTEEGPRQILYASWATERSGSIDLDSRDGIIGSPALRRRGFSAGGTSAGGDGLARLRSQLEGRQILRVSLLDCSGSLIGRQRAGRKRPGWKRLRREPGCARDVGFSRWRNQLKRR